MMKFLCGFMLCFSFFSCFCQDTLRTSKQIDTSRIHSPRKAVLLSALLPGSGQIYNHMAMPKGKKKAFWKVPLIYTGLGVTCFFAISNQTKVKSVKNDYTNRINGGLPDPQWEQYDEDGLITLYNQYQNRRDLAIMGLSIVYLIQVLDAGIEAHFVNFDISKDLSLSVEPTIIGRLNPGVKLNFNFHSNTEFYQRKKVTL
jgi:hypothetical protein